MPTSTIGATREQCTPNRPGTGAPCQLQLQTCRTIQNSLTEPFAFWRKAANGLAAAPCPAALRLQKACKKPRQLSTCCLQTRRAYNSREVGLFLCASGHKDWQNSPKSKPGRLPVSLPTPPSSSSAADDFLSGRPRSNSASQASAEALRRAAEMSQAVQSSLSGSQQAGTSKDMDYEDLLHSDYRITDDVDRTDNAAHSRDKSPLSEGTSRHTQPTFSQAADDSTHKNDVKVWLITKVLASLLAGPCLFGAKA
ncbi:TPA: hypothetical protein ACH3X2_006143 [Trebouxia sp. C0005]